MSIRDWKFVSSATVLGITVALAPMPALANSLNNPTLIQPSGLIGFQQCGTGVAADGTTIATATRTTSTLAGAAANLPGEVFVYGSVNGQWIQQAELTGDNILGDRFGASLGLQGNLLVVGAPGASGPNGQTGAVFLYTRNNGVWTEQGKLFPANVSTPIGFGGGVLGGISIAGNTLAIGAGADSGTGAVYIFVNTGGTWVQQARITPDDPSAAAFGASISLSGDNLLVGAQESRSSLVPDPGAAFVFTRNNGVWSQQARLDPAFPVAFGNYGESVSLDGTTAVVGAGAANDAYVYLNSSGNWTLQAHLTPADGLDDVDFGTALKVIGDLLLVGAYEDINANGNSTGVAYIYTRGGSTWTEHPDLRMAPGVGNLPGPAQDGERFANYATMTKAGSQTVFVLGVNLLNAPGFDPSDTSTWAATKALGGIYTATMN